MPTEAPDSLRERWSVSSKLTAFEVWLQSFADYRHVVGNHNRQILVRSAGGRGCFLTSIDDIEEAGRIGLKFYADADAVRAFRGAADAAGGDYRTLAALLSRLPGERSNSELAEAFDRLFEANIRCMAYYKVTGDEFTAACETQLQNELSPLGEARDCILLDALSTDGANLDVTSERREWLSLLRRHLGQTGANDKDLSAHADRYGYLGAVGGNPAGWSVNYYRARLQRPRGALEGELAALEQAEASQRERVLARATAENRLARFPWAALIIRHLRECTINRMFLRECFTSAANASYPLFRELYRRISAAASIPADDPVLRQLSMADIATFLSSGVLDIDELHRRQDGFTIKLEQGRSCITSGAHNAAFGSEMLCSARPSELSGRTVWGRIPVVGRAFVLDTGLLQSRKTELIATMLPGDILVTGMTHPNIIEACERASAIVTDEGGLTCHAAIVARELNIPCIVSTERATRVLRTGDMIKLDPVSGSVSIARAQDALK